MSEKLRLNDVRAMFRLIGDIRSMGSDPAKWRTHLVRRLHTLLHAAVVVSSEIHVRTIAGQRTDGKVRIIDVGWGCDGHDEIWQILECYPDRVDDPSPQSPDVRAARVFFFTCVSPGR